MAKSIIPLQNGANLPGLHSNAKIQQGEQQEDDVEQTELELGLDPDDEDTNLDENMVELDDGSVVINYKKTQGPNQKPKFYTNLADVFDEDLLDALATEYLEYVDIDREARKERDKQYEDGLRRTGLGKDAPGGATFDGASKVVHPVMAEACVDFAASSARELLPPDGIVRSEIKGRVDAKRLEVAENKVDFMNWQLTEQIPEYRDEMEQLLTQLPLGGSQYLKWRFDPEQKRPICEWVPIDNILLPYATTNFYTSQRAIEVQDITEDVYQQRIDQGIYRDLDNANYTSAIELDEQTRSQRANDKIEGKSIPSVNIDGVRRVYEITCYERLDDDDETEGRRAPYILTIDDSSGKVLGLYRNWAYGDEKLKKLDWYVEFKFIPWRGAYAIGLPHLIGGLAAALTGSLRALLDAAHISNSQTMLKLKGGRISGQSDRIEPTQVIEIEGSPGVDDVRKLAMPLPFNPPSTVLFNLLGWLTDAAKGVVTTAEEKIGDANANTPVGTTQALIEQGAKVFSSIHARLHRAQAKSLNILSRINHWYLEDMDNESGTEVEVRYFADNNDIRPVSDPNIFSETQRLAQSQATLQMAQSAPPGMFDLRAVYSRMLTQMKVPGIDEILPNPQGVKESNPALENVAMTMGRHSVAYPDQDHISHLKVHLAYAQDPNYGGSPMIGPTFSPLALDHIKQHLTLHYLQAMRAQIAEAAGGKDEFKLHEERPLDIEAQQALSLAAQLVQEDSQQVFAPLMPGIQTLVQKVQQMHQAQQEQAMQQDPTAQVILKTQMAETQRKAQEFETKMQTQLQQAQQEYKLKVAQLAQQVQELQAKYQTQTNIDNQKNATTIAMANINNSAKERIATINAKTQMDQQQMQLEHEQDLSAMQAIDSANQDIREHGFEVRQQAFKNQAEQINQQAQAQQQAAQAQAEHEQAMQQQAMQHQNQLIQQAAAPAPAEQPTQPSEGQ